MTDDINDYIKRLEDDVERTHRALVEQQAKIASLSYAMLGLLAERDLHRKEGAEEPHDVH